MATLEHENATDVTTDHWAPGESAADQRSFATRRMSFEAYASELETVAIERNAEFHATIVERLATPAPVLLDADGVIGD